MRSVVLVACGRGDKADRSGSEPANAHVAPAGKAAAAPGDLKSEKPPTVERPRGPVGIELLHGSAAKVAVSSVVVNNTIYPTDLVDGSCRPRGTCGPAISRVRGSHSGFRKPRASPGSA